MQAVRLVVLDMAGTTVADEGVVLGCFVEAARTVGLAVTAAEINDRMGMSKLEVFDELASRQLGRGPAADELRDTAYDVFRRVLEAVYRGGGAKPMPGAEATMRWLRDRGVRVALNTGFYRAVTELLITSLGWHSSVDAVVCADDVRAGRPAPYLIHEAMQRTGIEAVRTVLVAGDTPSDLRAGDNAGAGTVVGVLSGSHDAASLRREPHDHLCESVAQLPSLIERIERLSARTFRPQEKGRKSPGVL